jgi:ankyrin
MARLGVPLLLLSVLLTGAGRAESPLDTAVRSGNAQEVEHLLASGADPNAPDDRGNPPLVQAAWGGNTVVIASLINHGADVNRRNHEMGGTALLYAVLSGREGTVRLLLSKGARTDFRYRDDATILHIAAAKSSTQILEALLEAHADVKALDLHGNTALDEAVLQDRLPAASLLLQHGADPNQVHILDGRGPLHEACIKGFANLVKPLIAAGADPVRTDRFGLEPLELALDYQNEKVISALLHLDIGGNKLQAAAEAAMESATLRGQTGIAKLLIQGGLPINKPTAKGSTYLNDAALKGKKELVRLLLDHGANVNGADRAGASPLQNAALGGNPEVIGILLDRGAHIDAKDRDSQATALMVAASMGRANAVAILLQRGANPHLRDRFGRSALDRARQADDASSIRLLETATARAAPRLTS